MREWQAPTDEDLHRQLVEADARTADADLAVPSLVAGIFGSKRWMAELGRQGGLVRSERKAASARVNGAKGGRPRKAFG